MSGFDQSGSTIRAGLLACLVAAAGFLSHSASATEPLVVAAVEPTAYLPRASAPSAQFFTISQVLANHDTARQAIRPASASPSAPLSTVSAPSLRSSEFSDEPFDLFTFRAPHGLLWVKWHKLEAEIRADEHVMSNCRANHDQCISPAALRFLALIDKVPDLSSRKAIETINHSINLAIRYVSDQRQHGEPDLWTAPLATFAAGQGDCEDYAIAKYVAFRQLGLHADNLRLLLVRDRAVVQDHAVLGVRFNGRWLILDNRNSSLAEIAELPHFTPLYAIDHAGVKLFARPYAAAKPLQVTMAAAGDYW